MDSIIPPSPPNNNHGQQCRWHAYSNTPLLEQAAAGHIFAVAQNALDTRNAFHLVLAGGNTPRHVYELLRHFKTDWRLWHIYFGDERCLPAADQERNSHMAAQAWLAHVDIPAKQIHTIPAELGAQRAAQLYAQTVNNIALFDMVILGLGEDGHTASLFPQHGLGNTSASPAAIAVLDAPKPPAQRVSLSAHRLSQTRQLIFLVSGSGKQQAVAAWRHGIPIPAAAITPATGVDIYLEESLLKIQ